MKLAVFFLFGILLAVHFNSENVLAKSSSKKSKQSKKSNSKSKASNSKSQAAKSSNSQKSKSYQPSSSSSSSCMGCLSNTKTAGPIDAYLGKPVKNSIFTFYGAGGRGACGLDAGVPKMSAAGSGQLFKSDGQWKDACRADKQYMLDDPICKNICIKVDYNGKSLTVPINNKCPECPPNHVDLSIDAFNYLEPLGGLVGIAKGATLTYMKCPSNIKQC
ncbi:hypothetical protein niasHS_001912 [Heterodera schachtii]|uniref:RlpA-like protein double-psi beta-barrel domain-containing protein n=1 Tax=Heterodera schachtii TaxID=97005 RepID=A0ABD2KAT3_HETSC